jgi:hypothetical protein
MHAVSASPLDILRLDGIWHTSGLVLAVLRGSMVKRIVGRQGLISMPSYSPSATMVHAA